MSFLRVFEILRRMELAGVVTRYAIGGAVGATFYLEPVATLDLEVFVAVPPTGLLIDPSPVFSWLVAQGGTVEGEYIVIAGTPVQILVAGTPLVEEALREAVEETVEGIPVRVFTPEHLAAIALEVGRAKDKARVLQFVEAGVLDATRLEAMLVRHGLLARWETFQRQFLE